MSQEIVLGDGDYLETYELQIECSQLRRQNNELAARCAVMDGRKECYDRLSQSLSRIVGREIVIQSSGDLSKLKSLGVTWRQFLPAMDDVFGTPGALIQPSHSCLRYSFLCQTPELEDYVPDQSDFIGKILTGAQIRSREILREQSSENTEKAFKGDLVYWMAWLSAMRYTFEDEPIGAELVKAFIIQHIEGVPLEIDERLVEQGYKQSIGVHKMTTVKRRVASLSVQLQMQKLPNPCQDPEVRKLIEKLTKKYGENKNKSRAITLDILNDMLATCEDTLIGARDRALLLFAWASGGRRRSEVADADLKDLEMKGDGNYLYHMPKSKTDQEGRGKTVPVNGIAAGTLRRWIEISGVTLGKIFRSVSKSGNKVGDKITDVDINRIVKRRCEKAGYDPKLYTAHSLRSGFITEAGQRGCPLGDAMELSGHRSVNTAMGYYQVGNLKNNKAANLV